MGDVMSWVPPKSTFNLLQENYWPDEWKVLSVCLLLNLTTRKQVDGVIDTFFKKYPDAQAMIAADELELSDLIRPLGMWRKRVKTLKRFSMEYLLGNWKTAKELYGCGKYADDCWRLFFVGDWRDISPNDHALNDYHGWLKEHYEGQDSTVEKSAA